MRNIWFYLCLIIVVGVVQAVDSDVETDEPADGHGEKHRGKHGNFDHHLKEQHKLNFTKCCNHKEIQEQTVYREKVSDLWQQCDQEIRETLAAEDSLTKPGKRNKYSCISECIGKKLNYIDENGNLIEDAIKEHIKQNAAIADHNQAIADDVIDKCLVKSKKDIPNPNTGCSKTSIRFFHCLWHDFTKSCPKEEQIETPKCIEFYAKLERRKSSFAQQPETDE